jgi:hypothetical protein
MLPIIHLHRGHVVTTACRPVAPGSVKQSLLCGPHIGLLPRPDFHRRLLDGAGKRKGLLLRDLRMPDFRHYAADVVFG